MSLSVYNVGSLSSSTTVVLISVENCRGEVLSFTADLGLQESCSYLRIDGRGREGKLRRREGKSAHWGCLDRELSIVRTTAIPMADARVRTGLSKKGDRSEVRPGVTPCKMDELAPEPEQ
jgi:hypothetical protein